MTILVCGHHQSCPEGFTKDGNECITSRPIHGECPTGSTYKVSSGKCHFDDVHGH